MMIDTSEPQILEWAGPDHLQHLLVGVRGVDLAPRHGSEELSEFGWIHRPRLLTLFKPTGNINHCAI